MKNKPTKLSFDKTKLKNVANFGLLINDHLTL